MSGPPPALSARALVAHYPGRREAALNGVSLEVPPGERLLLLGPNGAGKSTFLRVFGGLMHAASGQALVGELLPAAARASVGYLGHQTFLYEELSALENLRLYGMLYGLDRAEERAHVLLGALEMGRYARERVGALSRGQQQRTGLARALLHHPTVLLLDEPDTGLDAAALELLGRLLEETPRTVVLATHRLEVGARLSTRSAVLAGGRVVGTLDRLTPSDLPLLREQLEGAAAV